MNSNGRISLLAILMSLSFVEALLAVEPASISQENYVDELVDCLQPAWAGDGTEKDFDAALAEMKGLKVPQYVIDSLVAWPSGSRLRIGFFGGNDKLWSKVEAAAKEWERWASITFEFRDAKTGQFLAAAEGEVIEADIRIGFILKGKTGGNWSKLGTRAARVPRTERTMNLGEPAAYPDGPRFLRVVLHEFGHALGFHHEHQHPVDKCDIDMDAAIRHFAKPPNGWTPEITRAQLTALQRTSGLELSDRDPESIMHYHLPADCFVSGAKSLCYVNEARKLSALDKKGVGQVYPRGGGTGFGGSVRSELEALAADRRLSDRSRAVIRAEIEHPPLPLTKP